MLNLENRQINRIFERIVKGKNGILVCVRFIVVEINGSFQPQIISATPLVISEENTKEGEIICLPKIKISEIAPLDTASAFVSFISPYFSLEFLMSQPTRAPSNR